MAGQYVCQAPGRVDALREAAQSSPPRLINGIQYLAGGALIVENCDIFGFGTNAINIAPSANTNRIAVTNTTLTNNTAGGLNVAPSAGTTNVFLSGVQAKKNGFGFGVAPTGERSHP